MKKLIFVRHAKSSWDDFKVQDFDRNLNERGFSDGPLMASHLQHKGFAPDVIITSAALRAKTTAHFFSDSGQIPTIEKKELYHAPPDVYEEIFVDLDDVYDCVMMVGHNPGITYIANNIQPGITHNVPTCGIIVAHSTAASWDKVCWQNLKIDTYFYPKMYTGIEDHD